MASGGDEEPLKVQGEAAHKTLRKHFPTLMKIVASGDIVETLYAEEIIEESTFEVVTAPGTLVINKQKGTKILKDVQISVHSKPKAFEIFCRVLKSEGHDDIVVKLKDTYTKCLEVEEDKVEKDAAGGKKPEFCSEIQELKNELDFYNKRLAKQTMTPESFYQCVRYAIQQAIEKALKAGNREEAIRNQLWILCHKDFDVPSNLRDWAMQEVEEICKRTIASMNPTLITQCPVSLPKKEEELPLFSKDTLYHASLCCHAISVCTAGNYETFLNSKSHRLEEASMSVSQYRESENVDRYIIAKCGNTIYVAFQSESTLSDWMNSSYSSFIDGLEKQTNRIPLRFFWELLGNKKRLVLTGFSFGGMLACYVAANLWKTSFISGDLLEKNVVCITFGQPLIPIPYVEEAIKDFPQFEATIHAIYDKDDFFPRVLYYYNVGCQHYYDSNQAIKTLSQTVDRPQAASLLASNTLKFSSTPFARKFLRCLAIIQAQTYSGAINSSTPPALSDFKKMLSEIIPHAEKYPGKAYGNGYLITAIEGKGIQWMPMPRKVISETGILRLSSGDKLNATSFKKHTMTEYGNSSFRSYIDREPGKFTAPGPVKEIKAISMLKPSATRVEFHIYPNEHVVVVEGENLWFCHKIQLGESDDVLDIKTPAQNVTQRMIQFNFPPYEKLKSLVSEGVVKVSLHSHFANPIRQNIQVMQEPYSFNLRQIQLAKNTPTEVIQLAFLSAMLEQYPDHACGKGPSERLKDVTHFLEEAVKVVPIESIFTAIAYMDDDTALECAKAVVAAQPKIPPSLVMLAGAQRAVLRMRTGVPPQVTDMLINVLTRGIIFTQRCLGMPIISISAPKHNQIKFTVSTPVDIVRPSYSDMIQGNVPEVIWETVESVHDLPPLPPELNVTTHPKLADKLDKYAVPSPKSEQLCNLISNLSIEHIYPVDSHRRFTTYISTLQSPLEVLRNAREKIASFIEESQQEDENLSQGTQSSNEQMLALVRDITEHNLAICAALLGAFMEQQIRIPLIRESEMDTAGILSEMASPVAMGVWALFSMGFEELDDKLSSLHGDPLLVEIADYISGVLSDNLQKPSYRSSKYDGKLQFLLQGIKRTVSCSSQYISYSLEHQLCSNLKFDKDIAIKKLIDDWNEIFHGDALSLVAKSHRPLIARWLKWAILIHDLRESLAKYTCVGVTGLVNSGKSQLVSKLFGVQVKGALARK